MSRKTLIIICCIVIVIGLVMETRQVEQEYEQEYELVSTYEITTEDGIRAEFVAIEAFDNVVDIYFTLEDLVGNRLDGDIDADLSIGHVEGREIGYSRGSVKVIDRTDEGIVTIHSRKFLDRSVEGQDLYFTLTRIYYNIEIYLDLAAAIPNAPAMQLTFEHEPFLWGEDSAKIDASFERLQATGLSILEPHLHNMELGLEGVETLISGIGMIDGRLHIQLYEPSPVNYSSIYLINPQGEWMPATLGAGFNIDEYSNFYQENIFDVDEELLSEYRLFGSFASLGMIELEWTVTLEVENNEMHLVAEGLNIQYGDYTIREIRLNPFALLLITESDMTAEVPNPEIRITTNNGAVATSTMGVFSRSQGWFIGVSTTEFRTIYQVDIEEDFFDLDSVISIEIAGETIEMR